MRGKKEKAICSPHEFRQWRRRMNNVSREKAGALIGCSASGIFKLENGLRKITLTVALAAAAAEANLKPVGAPRAHT